MKEKYRSQSQVNNLTQNESNYKDDNKSEINDEIRNNKVPKSKRRDKNSGIADIKAMFTSADALLPINEEVKRRSLEMLQKEISEKEAILVSSKRKIWLNRLRYADRSLMGFHFLACIAMLFLMIVMDMRNVGNESMITIAMILAGILGFLSVLEVGNICFAKLSELSETCFFNVRQMAAFDMILSGIINLTVLFTGILFAGFHWKMQLLRIGLYMLVPFIFAQCVCLGVLLTETGRRNVWLTAAAGLFLSVFYVMLASTPKIYTQSALFIWGIALIIGSAIFGIQVRALFAEISKGEILCTNWN